MRMRVMLTALLTASVAAGWLPMDEPVCLYPRLAGSDSVLRQLESPELVFTVESITRRISILGWASERYDLVVGEILSGELEEDTLVLYVYPECLLSARLDSLEEGDCLVVLAEEDSTHRHSEGFRVSDRDMAVVNLLGISRRKY